MARPLKEMPLYPSEAEIARELLGEEGAIRWKVLAPKLESRGMPIIDPVFGRRYWPAVRAWLDRRHGLGSMPVSSKPDGVEQPV